MKHTIASMLILLLGTSALAKPQAPKGGFFFIQLADPQLGMQSGNKDMVFETERLAKAVEHINRLKPAFVLVSGDMLNYAHDPRQTREFWRLAHGISADIPIHLVPGNHDLFTPSEASLRSYHKLFGEDHYTFSYGGSEFIVLNSPLLVEPKSNPSAAEAQKTWFLSELEAARKKNPNHLFVCTHHPWFLKQADEKDQYFNVPKVLRDEYWGAMRRYGVDVALAGHYHQEAIAADGNMQMITTSALGQPQGKQPSGLRVVRVYPDRVESNYYAVDQVPDHIDGF